MSWFRNQSNHAAFECTRESCGGCTEQESRSANIGGWRNSAQWSSNICRSFGCSSYNYQWICSQHIEYIISAEDATDRVNTCTILTVLHAIYWNRMYLNAIACNALVTEKMHYSCARVWHIRRDVSLFSVVLRTFVCYIVRVWMHGIFR